MKKPILMFMLFLVCTLVYSQNFTLQLLTSSGGQTDNNTYKTSWSIGEVINETAVSGTMKLYQGFQQGDFCTAPSINSQTTAAQTQCMGGSFSAINVTASGTMLAYQWYSKADEVASGGTAVGTNTYTYTASASVAVTLYYYCVVTGECGTATSTVSGAFVVRPAFTAGEISNTGQIICYNTTPTTIIGSTIDASGGDNTITYTWKSSADAYTAAISGAASATYLPSSTLTATTSYKRYAKDNTCNITPSVSTGTWTVTVRPQFTAASINTTGETICYNTTPTTTIGSTTEAGGGDNSITYSWRSSADAYTAAISGAASATYLPLATLTATTSYKRYAKDNTCNITPSVSTGTWTVTVRPQFILGTINVTGETICYNSTPTTTIGNATEASGGDNTITYSWRSSVDAYTASISGAALATYLPLSTLTATTSYRRYAKDNTCNITPSVSTGTWTVTVRPQFILGTINATGETICYNSTPTTTIGNATEASGGDNTITYSWKSSADAYTAAISGAASPTYLPSSTLNATTSYKRYAKDNTCNITPSVSTGTWTVTVRPQFILGTINVTGETICYNTSATTTIGNATEASGGDNTITYSWKSSVDAYTAAISGAASATYLPLSTLTATTSYRRYAKDNTCNITPSVSTGTWTVTVRPEFTSGSIAISGETVPYDGNPLIINNVLLSSGGNASITYQWQSSTDIGFSSPTTIASSNAATYDPPANILVTTWYRRQAKDGSCNTSFTTSSGIWKVAVNSASSLFVTNNLNSGYGSLRDAIEHISEGGIVTFTIGINNQTINLTTGTLIIDKNLSFDNSNHVSGISIGGSGDNITIMPGKSLTLSTGSRFAILGNIKNNSGKGSAGLVINSGASFIHNTVDLSATVKRLLNPGWHLFGSPFKQNTGSSLAGLKPVSGTVQMIPYTNGINWGTAVSSPYYYFLPTVGYAVKPTAAVNATLTGNLYYSPTDYTIPLIYNGTAATQSWNLLSNPYTSYINWNLLGKTNLNTSLYIWDNALYPLYTPVTNAAYFRTYNSCNNVGVPAGTTPYIAPLQGFFVRAVYTGPKLSFLPSARLHSTLGFYKGYTNTEILVRLKTETEMGADELVICKNPDAAIGFEQFDSEKLFGGMSIEFYSQSATGEKLVINTINSTETIIPLGINGSAGAKGKITAFAMETAEQVYLEDRLKAKFISLTENTTYDFEFSTDQLIGRFFVHFGVVNTIPMTSDVKVFVIENQLNVMAQTGEELQQIEIFASNGARVFKTEPGKTNLFTTELQLSPAIYLVRVKTNLTTQNVKIRL